MNKNIDALQAVQNAVSNNFKPIAIPNKGLVPLTVDNAQFFALTIELVDFQKSTLIQSFRGSRKQDLNNLCSHIQKWRTGFLSGLGEQPKANFDDLVAGAWEVLNAYMEAKDKQQFLAVCKCFNDGLVVMEGDERPANEVSFDEMMAMRKDKAA